jgi:hypothetical protein
MLLLRPAMMLATPLATPRARCPTVPLHDHTTTADVTDPAGRVHPDQSGATGRHAGCGRFGCSGGLGVRYGGVSYYLWCHSVWRGLSVRETAPPATAQD